MSHSVELEVVSGNCRVHGIGLRTVAKDGCDFTPSHPPGDVITFSLIIL